MSNDYERTLRELFERAGITVDGSQPHDIHVLNRLFYPRVLIHGELGLGESYMDGWWECDQLDEFICRVLKARLDKQVRGDWKVPLLAFKARLLNCQSQTRAFQVGREHYDIGNDLYQIMLDRRMNYTCAYWQSAKTLDQAQEAKLDLVCRKIKLEPEMTVLDLGCGWGCFAKYAAEKYGARVVGVTVSREQVELGQQLCQGLPVELRLQDYREVEGSFDRVISIGIMEHVGYKNYRTYMEVADRCLKEGGLAFIHTIGTPESRTHTSLWYDRYIFPNSVLPSIAQISKAMEGLFLIEDVHNIGPHYDRTLMAWWHNFKEGWPDLKDKYSKRFFRMWHYYLLSSAGAFRARSNQLWQMVMTRPGQPQPACRES